MTAPGMTPAEAPKKKRKRWPVVLAAVVLVPLLLGAIYTAFTLSWSYSDGERAGTLQKFSRKGWLCKTYEGELALYVVGGVAPEGPASPPHANAMIATAIAPIVPVAFRTPSTPTTINPPGERSYRLASRRVHPDVAALGHSAPLPIEPGVMIRLQSSGSHVICCNHANSIGGRVRIVQASGKASRQASAKRRTTSPAGSTASMPATLLPACQ